MCEGLAVTAERESTRERPLALPAHAHWQRTEGTSEFQISSTR